MHTFVSFAAACVLTIGVAATMLTPNKISPAQPSTGLKGDDLSTGAMAVEEVNSPFSPVVLGIADKKPESTEHEDESSQAVAASDQNSTPLPALLRTTARWKSFEQMHEHYTHAFVESEGNGISRAFTFNEPYQRRLLVNGKPHQVIELNLIGLMNEPVVYAAPWVGNVARNQLDKYETREMSDVEHEAVDRLRSAKTYVWQAPELEDSEAALQFDPRTAGTLIAGLRASSTCVACHEVDNNELLGAFIYKLAPVQDIRLNLPATVLEPKNELAENVGGENSVINAKSTGVTISTIE